jgi:hypothetical protein
MVMPTKGPWIVPSSSRSAFAISSHPLVRQVHNGSGEGLSSTLNEPGLAGVGSARDRPRWVPKSAHRLPDAGSGPCSWLAAHGACISIRVGRPSDAGRPAPSLAYLRPAGSRGPGGGAAVAGAARVEAQCRPPSGSPVAPTNRSRSIMLDHSRPALVVVGQASPRVQLSALGPLYTVRASPRQCSQPEEVLVRKPITIRETQLRRLPPNGYVLSLPSAAVGVEGWAALPLVTALLVGRSPSTVGRAE